MNLVLYIASSFSLTLRTPSWSTAPVDYPFFSEISLKCVNMFETLLSVLGTLDGPRWLIFAGYLVFMWGGTGLATYLDSVSGD